MEWLNEIFGPIFWFDVFNFDVYEKMKCLTALCYCSWHRYSFLLTLTLAGLVHLRSSEFNTEWSDIRGTYNIRDRCYGRKSKQHCVRRLWNQQPSRCCSDHYPLSRHSLCPAIIPFLLVNGMFFHMSLLWLHLIFFFNFFPFSVFSSFVFSEHIYSLCIPLPALEPHAPDLHLAAAFLLRPLPPSSWPWSTFSPVCSLLVGDCKVHVSSSCDGGQWPWGALIRRA